MNDFISKATFGFIMGQLFPGAIAVLALSFFYVGVIQDGADSVVAVTDGMLKSWSSATNAHQLFLLGLSIGAGMFIHGLSWSVLGTLETLFNGRVFDAPWHKCRIILQIMAGPVLMLIEIGLLLFFPKTTREASIEENVTRIHPSLMKQFEFLEDFYLYSSHFLAHTAHAVLAAGAAVTAFAIHNCHWTPHRVTFVVLSYLISGTFYTVGRIQLRSLFNGEVQLAGRSTSLLAIGAPYEGVEK